MISDRRHQPERGADRDHGRRRLGAGECGGRHGGGDAGRGRPGCGRHVHLCAGLRSVGQFEVVGNEVRVKAGASARLRDGHLARPHRDGHRCRRASRSEVISIAVTNQNEAPTDLRWPAARCRRMRRPARWWRRWARSTRMRATRSPMRWPRSVRQVRGGRQRGAGEGRCQPRLRDGHLARHHA